MRGDAVNLGPNQLHDELISGNQEDFVLTAQKKGDKLIQPPKDAIINGTL